MRLIRMVFCAGMVAAAIAVLPSAATASVKVDAACSIRSAVKKPRRMAFYCADNGMYATGLRWRSWGGKRARAFGTVVWKTCIPFCAAGGTKSSRGKVTLYRKVRCRAGVYRYSRLRVKAYHGPTQRVSLQTC